MLSRPRAFRVYCLCSCATAVGPSASVLWLLFSAPLELDYEALADYRNRGLRRNCHWLSCLWDCRPILCFRHDMRHRLRVIGRRFDHLDPIHSDRLRNEHLRWPAIQAIQCNGTAGSNTTFGVSLTANGGSGGTTPTNGGAGGTGGSGGNLIILDCPSSEWSINRTLAGVAPAFMP
jgi:hypothetical protein